MAFKGQTATDRRYIQDSLTEDTVDIIARIEKHHNVLGTLYIKNKLLQACTLPETMTQTLYARLPIYTSRVHQALNELDISDELIAYRIETKKFEILVKGDVNYTACVCHKLKKINKKRID